ncbi:MAG: leucyl aminopeptidase [bacterium]
MKIDVKVMNLIEFRGDALIVNLFEKLKKPGGATAAADSAIGGVISRKIKNGEFTGKLGETLAVPAGKGLGVENVIVVGLGNREKFDLDTVRKASAAAAQKCETLKARTAATILHGAGAGGIDREDAARAVAEGTMLGLYRFDRYMTKDKKEKEKRLQSLTIIERESAGATAIRKGVKLGTVLADATIAARDLVNEPASVMTPERLAQEARKVAKEGGLNIKVFGKVEIERMKMGGLLGVSRGSAQPPRFIVMRYKGDPNSKKSVGIIGKGITFDSGGLSLKPPAGMEDMKGDMAGAACVICTMKALSKLKPRINVTAVVPATENMPGHNAQKVGDVIRAMNGKSIEVLNTDAEGRLVLADAICYAKKQGLLPIVDVATLTGACMVALGDLCSGAFGNDKKLIDSIIGAAEKAGEKVWHMPIFDEYKALIKSDIADVKNVGGKWGGAITAALFLGFFYEEEVPWCHLDIAGPMFAAKDSFYLRKGASGTTVRTLTLWLLDRAKR